MVGLRVCTEGSESTKSLDQVRKHWNACATIYTSSVGTRTKANDTRTSSTVTLISSFDNSMPWKTMAASNTFPHATSVFSVPSQIYSWHGWVSSMSSPGEAEQLLFLLLHVRVNDLLMLFNYFIKYHLFNSKLIEKLFTRERHRWV